MQKLGKIAVFTVVVLLAVCAFAGDKTFTLHSPATINGQNLAAGEYKVAVKTSGNTADVQFLQGKKAVASATAEVVQQAQQTRDTATYDSQDGTRKLVQLQFAGQKTALKFSTDSVAGK